MMLANIQWKKSKENNKCEKEIQNLLRKYDSHKKPKCVSN